MKNKFGVTSDVEEIYRQWGEGPSADEYYEAVERFFKSKSGDRETYEEFSSHDQAA